jgi:hypothetical protein
MSRVQNGLMAISPSVTCACGVGAQYTSTLTQSGGRSAAQPLVQPSQAQDLLLR